MNVTLVHCDFRKFGSVASGILMSPITTDIFSSSQQHGKAAHRWMELNVERTLKRHLITILRNWRKGYGLMLSFLMRVGSIKGCSVA